MKYAQLGGWIFQGFRMLFELVWGDPGICMVQCLQSYGLLQNANAK